MQNFTPKIGKSYLRLGTAMIALGTGLAAMPAYAQEAPAPTSSAAAEENVIIVTGSRIARPDLEQASPVSVVSSEEFNLQGATNVENVLNDLPQVTASTSGTDNNPGGGIATVNLRGIGTQRTLVLVDGRRYLSYDTDQVVDLNTVPAALIERVDVVTGGRSAVYGSDAIAGVVNFITKRNFEGVALNGNYELSSRGDGARYVMDGTIGANVADGRGNVTVHASYYKRKPILAGARRFSARALQDNNDGSFIFGGSSSISQGRVQIAGLGSLLGLRGATGAITDNGDFGTDGSLTGYVAATDAYNFAPVNYLQVGQERYLISMKGNYEISDAVEAYVEGQYVNNRVPNVLAATPIGNNTPYGGSATGTLTPLQLQVNSPFFAPSVRAAFATLDAGAAGALANDGYVNVTNFGFRTVGIGPRINNDERNAYRMVGGVRGDLGSSWSYDGYFMYARTKNTQQQTGNVQITNFLAATRTAFQNPGTGAISPFPFAGVAGGGTLVCTTPAGAVVSGCTPANLFGEGNLSPEAAAFLAVPAVNIETYQTQVASFALTNSELFDFGAGPVGIALGVEHRRERGSVQPDLVLSSGNVAGFNAEEPTTGSYNVTEFFGELNAPILSGMSFVNKLEVNAAVRYSKYSIQGGNKFNALSWAAGGLYEPTEGLGFRGQYQRAIRGPSVSELFLGNTVDFQGGNEYCNTPAAQSGQLRDLCLATGVPAARLGDPTLGETANPATFFGGNPNLREEKGTTWTLGAVFAPKDYLRGFSATIDYWNIKVDGYISNVGGPNILTACYEQFLTEYCDLVQRDTNTGEYARLVDTTANTGGLKTSGVDVALNYNLRLGQGIFGAEESRLGFAFAGTRLLKYDFTPVIGLPLVNECAGKFGAACSDDAVAGEPLPKWRHTFRVTYADGPVTISGLWRHLDKVVDDDPATQFAFETLGARDYFDLTLQVEPTENYRLTFGISNIFDKEPPLTASVQNFGNGEQSNTYPNTYDVLGRYFFVGASVKF